MWAGVTLPWQGAPALLRLLLEHKTSLCPSLCSAGGSAAPSPPSWAPAVVCTQPAAVQAACSIGCSAPVSPNSLSKERNRQRPLAETQDGSTSKPQAVLGGTGRRNYRITEWVRSKGTNHGVTWFHLPAQTGPSRAGAVGAQWGWVPNADPSCSHPGAGFATPMPPSCCQDRSCQLTTLLWVAVISAPPEDFPLRHFQMTPRRSTDRAQVRCELLPAVHHDGPWAGCSLQSLLHLGHQVQQGLG